MTLLITRLDYCPFLLASQIHYTLTYFADHCDDFSHDAINRYLRRERMTPRLIWDNVRNQVTATPTGYLVFDDTVRDKNFSQQIELPRIFHHEEGRHSLETRIKSGFEEDFVESCADAKLDR
jgi:hypothetical protein